MNLDNLTAMYVLGSTSVVGFIEQEDAEGKKLRIEELKNNYCKDIPEENIVIDTLSNLYPLIEEAENKKWCKPMKEITKDEYWDIYECLPPGRWEQSSGAVTWVCIEAITSDIHSYYCSLQGRYFVKNCRISQNNHESIASEALALIKSSKPKVKVKKINQTDSWGRPLYLTKSGLYLKDTSLGKNEDNNLQLHTAGGIEDEPCSPVDMTAIEIVDEF